MDLVRMLISYNGRWEELPHGSQRYVGAVNKGILVQKNFTYEELLGVVQSIVKHDQNKYAIEMHSIAIAPGSTCRTMISDNDDVQFVLREDKAVPQVCVTLVERRFEDPQQIRDEHYGSFSGSNQVFNQRSSIFPDGIRQCSNNVCLEPYETVNLDRSYAAPNFDEGDNHVIVLNHPQEHHTFEEPIHEEPTRGSALPRDVRGTPADTENVNTENVNTENVNIENGSTENMNDMTEWTILGSESYSFGDATTTMASTSSNTLIFKGQFFPRKKDLKRLAGLYALIHNFEWKVKRSNKSVIHMVCKIENCSWKLRAVRLKEGTYFHVRSFIDKHNCPLEVVHRRHRQASAAVIGELVAPRIHNEDGRIMRPSDIITDMKQMYGIQMLYSKAYECLKYALSVTYGTHEESFPNLPRFAYVLEQQNPGTITDVQFTDDNKFLYFFMALGASIRGFRRCMRPVIIVDGTHLKGSYKGTMFVAATMDGNEQIYPLAFGYGDSENNESWEWFLESLRGAIGHVEDLVFVSDRHQSIQTGVEKVFPYAAHAFCIWHLSENVKKTFHRKDVAEMFQRCARAYTQQEYDFEMEELHRVHKKAYDYVVKVGPPKWSRIHCPYRRFNLMTSNVAECLNSCMRFARRLPVMSLAEFIRNLMQKWFYNRHRVGQSMRSQLTDAAHQQIAKRIEECNYMSATPVDWNIFQVKLRGEQWTVNLQQKTCTCKVFDLDLLPCAHALAAARERHLDYISLCADYYKKVLIDAYSIPIMPVGHPSSWVVPEDVRYHPVIPPDIRNQPGRPCNSRHRSASERRNTQKCSQCGAQGHNSRNCPNPPMIQRVDDASTSNPVPAQYRRKCSICHQVGHNKQTCPNKEQDI